MGTITLTLERQAYGPEAIAHDKDGKCVFVAGGVAGDVVEAEVIESGPRFSRARVTSVVSPSPDRVQAPCPYAALCGGCPWMALTREAQVKAKRDNVVSSLVRIAHMDPERADQLVSPCETPSGPLGYRNKVELALVREGRTVRCGMHTGPQAPQGTPEVVKVDTCLLLDKRHARLPRSVAGALSYLAGSSELDVSRVGVRTSSRTRDTEVALWDRPGPFPRAQVAKVLADACKPTSVVRVLTKGTSKARKVTGVEVLSGRGHWRERVGNHQMMLSAPSFFQVNTPGAERLVELVLEALSPTDTDEAMDLYCGAGTFTLPLADAVGFVSAVEAAGPAVRDLRRNLDAAHAENVEPIGGDAGREFPDVDADVIVVDPPRAGLAEDVVDKLSAQSARSIAYVSCDPATLARDLARFSERGVYQVASVMPVDLFPQTYHVETVVLMSRIQD